MISATTSGNLNRMNPNVHELADAPRKREMFPGDPQATTFVNLVNRWKHVLLFPPSDPWLIDRMRLSNLDVVLSEGSATGQAVGRALEDMDLASSAPELQERLIGLVLQRLSGSLQELAEFREGLDCYVAANSKWSASTRAEIFTYLDLHTAQIQLAHTTIFVHGIPRAPANATGWFAVYYPIRPIFGYPIEPISGSLGLNAKSFVMWVHALNSLYDPDAENIYTAEADKVFVNGTRSDQGRSVSLNLSTPSDELVRPRTNVPLWEST